MNAFSPADSYSDNASFLTDRGERSRGSERGQPSSLGLPVLSRSFLCGAGTLAMVALGVSIYLAWVGLTSSKVVGCDGGVFDCSHVLTSHWSLVAGIPVSIPAAGLYVGVLATLMLVRSRRTVLSAMAWHALMILSMTAALTAIWFISLQLFSIGNLCPYCLAVHGCGIALAALVIHRNRFSSTRVFPTALISVTLVGGLIATQALSEGPSTFVIESANPVTTPASGEAGEASEIFEAPIEEAPLDSTSAITLNPLFSLLGVVMAPQDQVVQTPKTESKPRRMVPVNNGRKQLDVTQWPLWGNAESKNVVVEMFDYTCSHCRNTHVSIREASKQLGGDFAVIALPVPLNAACNDTVSTTSPERADACEVARIAIAVWMVDRTKFTAFHDWLFEQSRSAAEARQHAATLVDAETLTQTLGKSTPGTYIQRNVQLYKEAGGGTVPKISFPTTTVVGEVGSGTTIAGMVRQYLGQN